MFGKIEFMRGRGNNKRVANSVLHPNQRFARENLPQFEYLSYVQKMSLEGAKIAKANIPELRLMDRPMGIKGKMEFSNPGAIRLAAYVLRLHLAENSKYKPPVASLLADISRGKGLNLQSEYDQAVASRADNETLFAWWKALLDAQTNEHVQEDLVPIISTWAEEIRNEYNIGLLRTATPREGAIPALYLAQFFTDQHFTDERRDLQYKLVARFKDLTFDDQLTKANFTFANHADFIPFNDKSELAVLKNWLIGQSDDLSLRQWGMSLRP